ncbi:MAG: serine/threonine protein kinase [Planctomycetes bacterium]|nr:serine/threonine protein kinase [Planctomycetota bacterium]
MTGPVGDLGGAAAIERFGDIAIELGLLTPTQVQSLLEKQRHYKDLGIPMRIDSIAVDMGILARTDCNLILGELRKRRKLTQPRVERPTQQQDDEDLIVPCRLGPFEVEERLGGVMGAVYRAYDTNMNRHVALKLLPRSLSHDRQLVERFQREARAAGKLSHPNVVAFYAAGEVEKRYYISMEYVDGESLTERLERVGRIAERESLTIIRELAHALYHAHVNNLLHRDVKPDNVIIDRAGRVRLTDMGLAKVLTEDTRLTESGIAIGTPHYISPEQARGDRVIDRRADLYGLGATLFHLVCGRPPYDGNAAEVMRKHVFVAPPDPKAISPEISDACRNLILKLMAKDPNQRLQSADALIATINSILNEKGTQIRSADAVRTPASRRKSFSDSDPTPSRAAPPVTDAAESKAEGAPAAPESSGDDEALPGIEEN